MNSLVYMQYKTNSTQLWLFFRSFLSLDLLYICDIGSSQCVCWTAYYTRSCIQYENKPIYLSIEPKPFKVLYVLSIPFLFLQLPFFIWRITHSTDFLTIVAQSYRNYRSCTDAHQYHIHKPIFFSIFIFSSRTRDIKS